MLVTGRVGPALREVELSGSGDGRRILGMSCGQLVLLLILLLVSLAAVGGGVYWVLSNPDLTGGPALPTAFQVNSPVPPTRTSGPVVLPPTWTVTPSVTPTATLMPSETPTETPPPSQTPSASPTR
jgi:hypothetical protein